MNASQLVPGISKYPELEAQLNQRIAMQGVGGSKCSACTRSKLAREFGRKLRDRVERDKLMGRG